MVSGTSTRAPAAATGTVERAHGDERLFQEQISTVAASPGAAEPATAKDSVLRAPSPPSPPPRGRCGRAPSRGPSHSPSRSMVAAVAAAEAAASTQKSSMLSGSGTGKEQKEQPGVVERLMVLFAFFFGCPSF